MWFLSTKNSRWTQNTPWAKLCENIQMHTRTPRHRHPLAASGQCACKWGTPIHGSVILFRPREASSATCQWLPTCDLPHHLLQGKQHVWCSIYVFLDHLACRTFLSFLLSSYLLFCVTNNVFECSAPTLTFPTSLWFYRVGKWFVQTCMPRCSRSDAVADQTAFCF